MTKQRYVVGRAAPQAIQAGDDYWPETRETMSVVVTDNAPHDTGLVDERGVTIWRLPSIARIGFLALAAALFALPVHAQSMDYMLMQGQQDINARFMAQRQEWMQLQQLEIQREQLRLMREQMRRQAQRR